jgi:hypothetical protein
VYIGGVTNGFEIRAPADRTPRTLKVYCGLYGAQGNFQAYLSDFSAQAFTDTSISNVFGNSYCVYTLNYAAATEGQQLVVHYTVLNLFDFDYGNVTLAAATLAGPPPLRLINAMHLGDDYTFAFQTEAGVSYAAQFTPSLSPLAWQTFDMLSGTGGLVWVTNRLNSGSERYYRVLKQ